jgi:hypothetical protein
MLAAESHEFRQAYFDSVLPVQAAESVDMGRMTMLLPDHLKTFSNTSKTPIYSRGLSFAY